MSLLLLSLAAGALTVLSPCVLPVLPFVLARPGSGRLFGGLAIGFGAVMLLATAGSAWAVQAHDFGRSAALGLLAAFGLALASPTLTARALRPLQSLAAGADVRLRSPRLADWLLGASTGLLWAPCAGPVLGFILTAAALQGGGWATALPLLAYAAGASATLLVVRALIARAGQRVPAALRAAVPWADATRRLTGGAVLAAVLLIATGWDTRLAAAFPGTGLDQLEQAWLERWPPAAPQTAPQTADATARAEPPQAMPALLATGAQEVLALPVLGTMPSLAGANAWLQSPPLDPAGLRGKVVLVDFWTFGCVNCQRALPAVRNWARRYRGDGLVVIGVHAPEFAFERDRGNVERAVRRMDLDFPIAIDNDFAVWNAWSNHYWPTLYLVDAQGRVRWRHIGEGAYIETEQAIRQLLDEAKRAVPATKG